jgi:hypothetical protein
MKTQEREQVIRREVGDQEMVLRVRVRLSGGSRQTMTDPGENPAIKVLWAIDGRGRPVELTSEEVADVEDGDTSVLILEAAEEEEWGRN